MAKRRTKAANTEPFNTKVHGERAPKDLTDPQRIFEHRSEKLIDLIPSGTMTREQYWKLVRGEDPPERETKT